MDQPQVLTIPNLLQSLQGKTPPEGGVLTAYVATSPRHVQGEAYLLTWQNGCKAIRAGLPATEHPAFEAAALRLERYLSDELTPTHPGLALFASPQPDYFFVALLPAAPAESVLWGPLPVVAPLAAALDDYERVAVALFDKERARLFTVFLGEIEERRVLEDEVPGKQSTGGWFGLAQGRYARHHEDHVLRHTKHATRALMSLLRNRPFDRLLVGGPSEAVTVLRHQLPGPLRARLAGTLQLELFASEADVLRAALQASEVIERQKEVVAVDELLEAPNGGRAALGPEQTLAALNDGRVYTLFVADTLMNPVHECERCRHLVVRDAPCPVCGASTGPAGDLRARAIARALEQGARIEQVSAEAAARLLEYGGIGAWTRY
jgi:hypothetical protein